MQDDDFQRLFETYHRPVQGFFRRRGFTEEHSEDLAQETFFRIYRSRGTYEERDRPAAWVFHVARNVGLTEHRNKGTQKRRGNEETFEEEECEGSPPRQDDEVRRRELQEAIEELPKMQRLCLTLWLVGWTYPETGKILRIRPETVKKHLVAARKRLRDLLGLEGLRGGYRTGGTFHGRG